VSRVVQAVDCWANALLNGVGWFVVETTPGCDEAKVTAMRYAVVIENTGTNYSAYVPDLPESIKQG
jgi:hypothetical protein